MWKGSMEEIYQNVYEGVNIDEKSEDEREDLIELVYERMFNAIGSNDPTMTAFHPIDLYLQPIHGCAQRLGDALAKNNHIQWIQLRLDTHLFGASTSLLQYLRQGSALRRVDVEIHDDEGGDDMAYRNLQLVIQALTESLSLETLKLGIEHSLPLDALVVRDVARLIQTTTSLRELNMTWTDNHNIAAAFVSNRTIQVLRLTACWYDDTDIRGHLLSNYVAQSSVPSLLTELSVGFRRNKLNLPELDIALSTFLRIAAPSLQKLSVHSMAFDDKCMEQFLNGIRYHETLHKLELILCIFNDDATQSFIKFWQNVATTTSIESGDNDTNAPRQPQYNIKSLYLSGDVRDYRSNVLAASTSDTTNMAQVLALSLQKSCLLERLHWAPYHHANYEPAQFWNTVSDNAGETRLSSLRLDCMDEKGFEAILRCLPKLHHLRVFQCQSFKYNTNQIPEHLLLDMVRTNGSLFRFPDDDNDKDWISIWDRHPAVKPRIHAYFQRNEGLSKLLARPRIEAVAAASDAAASDDDDDRHAKRAKKENPVEDNNVEMPTFILLIPLLFAAARPLTYMAPNYILIGLLELVDPIGPVQE